MTRDAQQFLAGWVMLLGAVACTKASEPPAVPPQCPSIDLTVTGTVPRCVISLDCEAASVASGKTCHWEEDVNGAPVCMCHAEQTK
jgi:hypothetical protein